MTIIKGCYHANGVAEAMFNIAAKYDIVLTAYDYNEAQQVSFIFNFY